MLFFSENLQKLQLFSFCNKMEVLAWKRRHDDVVSTPGVTYWTELPGLNLACFYREIKISSQKPVRVLPPVTRNDGETMGEMTRQDEVTSLKTS